jgi:hypothetical protein
MYYGQTLENGFVFQPKDSYQLGCPSPTAYLWSWGTFYELGGNGTTGFEWHYGFDF